MRNHSTTSGGLPEVPTTLNGVCQARNKRVQTFGNVVVYQRSHKVDTESEASDLKLRCELY